MVILFQQNDSRVYMIGNKSIEIPKKTIDQFIVWSTYPYNKEEKIDKKIVHELLKLLKNNFDINQRKIPNEYFQFISSTYLFLYI